jgi:alpha-tubulin suppressor-like RCC1 family protein
VDPGVQYTKVVATSLHACGITIAGRVKCWGNNGYGRLGDGSGTARSTPVFINDSSLYLDISSGGNFNCGVTNTNLLKCWGRNFDAQLGNGDTFDQSSPVVIDSGVLYDLVSASSGSTCARQLVSQKYKCWGIDSLGNLGLKHPNRMYPVNYVIGFEN